MTPAIWLWTLIFIALFAILAKFSRPDQRAAERQRAQRAEDASHPFGCAGAFIIVAVVAVLMIAAAVP